MSLLINHFYRFGEFTLDTDQRVLLREGKLFPMPPKVFDTLLILVANNGRLVERDELMRRLWPDTFVEEANLSFNIQQLRKSLGDNARRPRFIETIPRRGYRFIASVEEVLIDSDTAKRQITQRPESSDVQPNPETQIGAHTSGLSLKLAIEDSASLPGNNLTGLAAGAASTGLSKKSVALVTAIVIALVGIGLVFWKLSNSSNRSSARDKRVDASSPVLPLKIEKLTATGQSRLAAISPDGKYIAYTRNIEKRYSIWLRQLATKTNVEIASAESQIYGLAFSNSSEYLYFVKGHPTSMYRVSILGGVPSKIVDRLEGNFSVSSDDSQIVFIRQDINVDGHQEYSLIVINADGSDERVLFVGTYPNKLDAPLWSPDSGSIICAYGYSEGGSQDVSIIEVKVGERTKRELSSDRFSRIAKMAWLPDKSELIMSARNNPGDNNQLWRVSYPGMEISQITEALSPYLDLSIASNADKAVATQATLISDIWIGLSSEHENLKKVTQATYTFCTTPDGRVIYSSTASGNVDLWIMRADGTEQKQLTLDPAVDLTPAVTPDNRYIAFVSNRTSTSQVWRMNIDGSNQIQLTNGEGKNFPSISSDGKWVLYNTTGDWHLWKISIEGGEPIKLTEHIATRPSVSPNGKLIACIGRDESKREILILPFEGGQPLKRFGFAGWTSRLQWAEDGKALIYTTELDGTTSLMKQLLGGSPPQVIASFDEGELFDFGFSFDGQMFAVTRGGWQHDIVLISDLNKHQ